MYKQAIPIVNLYNSRDHYCLTATLPPAEQNTWRIKQAAHYLDITIQLFNETDKSALNTQDKNILRALETDINHFKLVFKVQAPDTVVTRTLTKSVGKSLAGSIHPVPGPIPSTSSDLNPSGPEKKHSKQHTCHICGKVLYKLGDLNDHIRNHHPDQAADSNKPTCSFCGKVLLSKSNLKVHEKKHKRILINNCTECDYGTNNKQTLASHVIAKHISKEEAEKLPTFDCDKSFVTKQLLQKHLYSGKCNLEKIFQCDICKNWVKSKESLDEHISKYHEDASVLLDC